MLYQTVAINLTRYENHRTGAYTLSEYCLKTLQHRNETPFPTTYAADTAYEDALIAKTFIFQFVNSFASLFYIAFVKPYIPTLDACLTTSVLLLSCTVVLVLLFLYWLD